MPPFEIPATEKLKDTRPRLVGKFADIDAAVAAAAATAGGAVQNGGGAPAMAGGLLANRPATFAEGGYYFSESRIDRFAGGSWTVIVSLNWGHLLGKPNFDALYVNEADHNKALHDAMGINAAALDGFAHTAFEKLSNKGIANGYAGVGSDGYIPTGLLPPSVVGAVDYQGTWNAATNTPALDNAGTGRTKGDFYVVSVAGSISLGGYTDWQPKDWLIWNGAAWDKIDNTDSVTSVNSQVGAVNLTATNIPFSPVGNLAAVNVQAAMAELDTEKSAVGHGHSGEDITSGTVPVARIGAGTKDTTTFYRGDGTFAVPSVSGLVSHATLALLKGATGMTDRELRVTESYAIEGDGGGAMYRYDSASAATANDFTVIAPASGVGRWFIVGDVVDWRGAGVRLNDGATDYAVQIQRAIDACKNTTKVLFFGGVGVVYHTPVTVNGKLITDGFGTAEMRSLVVTATTASNDLSFLAGSEFSVLDGIRMHGNKAGYTALTTRASVYVDATDITIGEKTVLTESICHLLRINGRARCKVIRPRWSRWGSFTTALDSGSRKGNAIRAEKRGTSGGCDDLLVIVPEFSDAPNDAIFVDGDYTTTPTKAPRIIDPHISNIVNGGMGIEMFGGVYNPMILGGVYRDIGGFAVSLHKVDGGLVSGFIMEKYGKDTGAAGVEIANSTKDTVISAFLMRGDGHPISKGVVLQDALTGHMNSTPTSNITVADGKMIGMQQCGIKSHSEGLVASNVDMINCAIGYEFNRGEAFTSRSYGHHSIKGGKVSGCTHGVKILGADKGGGSTTLGTHPSDPGLGQIGPGALSDITIEDVLFSGNVTADIFINAVSGDSVENVTVNGKRFTTAPKMRVAGTGTGTYSDEIWDVTHTGAPPANMNVSPGSEWVRTDASPYYYEKTTAHGNTTWATRGGPDVPLLKRQHIEGLLPTFVSGTQVEVSAGSAWVPGASKVVEAAATITPVMPTLAASTWYYVYLYDNAGVGAIDISTTAPAVPYAGTARAKSADTTRRYLGAFRTSNEATPRILNFRRFGPGGSQVEWHEAMSGTTHALRVLSIAAASIVANTRTTVSCAGAVPPTVRGVKMNVQNLGGVSLYLDNSESGLTGAAGMRFIVGGNNSERQIVLNASQELIYYSASGTPTGNLILDVLGYTEAR